MNISESVIVPQWSCPNNIRAMITTRSGGVSKGPYKGLNLGDHVGDVSADVESNRSSIYQHIGHKVDWLKQVHGTNVVTLDGAELSAPPEADGAFSSTNAVCAVMTADCLPILLCDREGREVAAVHAGWRSLAHGIVPAALAKFSSPNEHVLAYLGPAISQGAFEVGEDVMQAFCEAEHERQFAEKAVLAFSPSEHVPGKFYADIYRLAKAELQGLGVKQIFGGDYCTYAESRFYSYRRDGVTGRMASLIWIEPA